MASAEQAAGIGINSRMADNISAATRAARAREGAATPHACAARGTSQRARGWKSACLYW